MNLEQAAKIKIGQPLHRQRDNINPCGNWQGIAAYKPTAEKVYRGESLIYQLKGDRLRAEVGHRKTGDHRSLRAQWYIDVEIRSRVEPKATHTISIYTQQEQAA